MDLLYMTSKSFETNDAVGKDGKNHSLKGKRATASAINRIWHVFYKHWNGIFHSTN